MMRFWMTATGPFVWPSVGIISPFVSCAGLSLWGMSSSRTRHIHLFPSIFLFILSFSFFHSFIDALHSSCYRKDDDGRDEMK